MEIQGRITQVFEPRGGVSARTGNSWKVQQFLLETMDQYPRRLCFEVFGEDKLSLFNIQVGQELTVFFDVDAHEYQGRWYNQIRAWKVEPIQAGAAAAQQPVQQDPFAAQQPVQQDPFAAQPAPAQPAPAQPVQEQVIATEEDNSELPF